jgi:ribosomal protein S18 acetylase RimI-like enzyme
MTDPLDQTAPSDLTTSVRLETRRAVTSDAAIVASWSQSADEIDRWSSVEADVVTVERILGWWEPDDVEPWVLESDGAGAVGYGELWLDAHEDEIELARLIVAPEMRGKGIGKRLAAALVDKASTTGLGSVILRVRPDNPVAIHCYRASGFHDISQEEAAVWNIGQRRQYLWMVYDA